MASTNKLYPPIINGVLPAFYRTTRASNDDTPWEIKITVPFSMNQMVGTAQVKSMFLRLKTVQTNEVKYCGPTDDIDFNNNVVYFRLSASQGSELIEGLFYKAQIAYCSEALTRDDNWDPITPEVSSAGYFSTVSIIKCIAKPSVSIADFDESKVNLYNNRYLGVYEQNIEKGDSNEKVYSYCFTITDKDGNEYITSGVQLHNSNNDINHWSSEDEFLVNKLLVPGQLYYLQYKVTTVNGLEIASPTYRLMAGESVAMEKEITLNPELNYDEGYIQINMRGPRKYYLDTDQHLVIVRDEDYCSGLFLLSRGYLKDDYMVWEDISRFCLNNEKPSNHIERDFTIEQGITYKYRLQQYNANGIYSKPVYSKEIYADFEDMFLYDGIRQLKVRFNPKVASFKVDIPEQKIETIGSKYPFIFRNGNVYYHEFPISGLISYQLDEAKLFLNGEEIIDGNLLDKSIKTKDNQKDVIETSFNYDLKSPQGTYGYQKYDTNNVRMDKDLTSENLMSERYFKLAVLSWLTNGEIKLFRSPGEGNYLVRLLNTSMTPNDTLGRMLHTFNTTAYEIADLTYDNLLQYNLITVGAPEVDLTQTSSIEFTASGDTKKVLYTRSDNDTLLGFEVHDCMPGDKLIITFTDGSTETITIGVTGSFSMTQNDKTIESIVFVGLPDYPFNYPHTITLSYIGEPTYYFDQITKVTTTTIVGQTYCGPQLDLVNFKVEDITTGKNYHKFNIKIGATSPAYKTKLLNMEMLRVRAREIIPIYQTGIDESGTKLYSTTPFGVGYPIRELKEMRNSDLKIVGGFAIFALYVPNNGTIPNVVAHEITLESNNSDKQYNEMYPDWVFSGKYYDIIADEEVDTIDTRFAINMDLEDPTSLSYVDVKELHELALYDLGPISRLWLGNGVQAETVMRIQVIDYAIEDTDATVAAKKDKYIQAKAAIFTDYSEFLKTHADDLEAYNNYLVAVEKAYQAAQDYAVLYESYNALSGLAQEPSVFKTQIINAIDNAIHSINQYRTEYLDIINHATPVPSAAASSENKPTINSTSAVSISDDDISRINNAVMSNPSTGEEVLANVVTEVITQLNAGFSEIQSVYRNWLNVYYNNIPGKDTSGLPDDWETAWKDVEKPVIIENLATSLLENLNRMYDLLRKDDAENPYTEDYFSNCNISLEDDWNNNDVEIVLTTQDNVCGIEELTYEDIFPNIEQDISDYGVYDENSLILSTYNNWAAINATLPQLKTVLDDAIDDYNSAKAIQDTAYETIQDLLTANQELEADKQEQQKKIDTARALIAGLELEEQTEANIAAIKYLNLLIDAATAAINNDNTNIEINEGRIEDYLTGNDLIDGKSYPDLVRDTEAKLAERNEAQRNYNIAFNEAETAKNNITKFIAEWNLKLKEVKSKLDILTQVSIFIELIKNNEDIGTQINNYLTEYSRLVNSNNAYTNTANSAINEISSLLTAFDKLASLLTEWQEKLEELEQAKQEPEAVAPPAVFDWEAKAKQIEDYWNEFISSLSTAYQQVEKRYV